MDLEGKQLRVSKNKFVTSNIAYKVFAKRLLDVVISLIFLLVLIPLFIAIAVIIKVDDPKGKIFFYQERIGINGKKFKMYKFRSMYSDAEKRLEELLKLNEVKGAMFKMKDDPRVTKFGRVIRKYSLDEFPQLYNVLKGEMSLVGPRPPLTREFKQYSTYDKQRLLVKPGITGLWQVSGRSSLSFSDMVKLDLQYIENISLLNDLKILIKTIAVVLKTDGAY